MPDGVIKWMVDYRIGKTFELIKKNNLLVAFVLV